MVISKDVVEKRLGDVGELGGVDGLGRIQERHNSAEDRQVGDGHGVGTVVGQEGHDVPSLNAWIGVRLRLEPGREALHDQRVPGESVRQRGLVDVQIRKGGCAWRSMGQLKHFSGRGLTFRSHCQKQILLFVKRQVSARRCRW